VDVRSFNREAWDKQVEGGNRWTIPVDPQTIALARKGVWQVYLTPLKPTPREWFPETLYGIDLLGLACGGGQQGPIFASVGARVTILDNSPKQLTQDQQVAEREGLTIRLIEGDMRDLLTFPDESFDLIFNPVSNVFVPEVLPIWRESHRVLRPGGILLTGFMNPTAYIFDYDLLDKGQFEVRYAIPYSDVNSLSAENLQEYSNKGYPLEFSHTLEEQIGGQLQSGFTLTGLYEDRGHDSLIDNIFPAFIATRAIKSDWRR
jgi:SAM-dependent methyltransferase